MSEDAWRVITLLATGLITGGGLIKLLEWWTTSKRSSQQFLNDEMRKFLADALARDERLQRELDAAKEKLFAKIVEAIELKAKLNEAVNECKNCELRKDRDAGPPS